MIKASDFGFSPENDGKTNSAALQKAVDCGGDIYIDVPGTYLVSQCITIGSDTAVYFCAGSYIKRCRAEHTSYVFINKGAYTRKYDRNIKISGLKIICDGVEATNRVEDGCIPGMRGHISFFYIINLVIDGVEILDLPSACFGIQVCTFENILIENVRIEGRKDAVHLGRGSKFVIRHGIFRTFDDPIALNAHDYASSNPQLGWIENGIIEDCYDLDDSETVGFFCRILAGAWGDWKKGMEVQNSDTVAYEGRLYRVLMEPDGKVFESVTPPTHESGIEVLDGIRWVMVQDDVVYGSGCRNIHFKDIYLQKKRDVALSVHFDKDRYSRSYYPGAVPPVQENIIFENICFENHIPRLLDAITPVDSIKVINSVMDNSSIGLKDIETEGMEYQKTNILFSGTTFRGKGGMLVETSGNRSASVKIIGSCSDEGYKAEFSGNVTVKQSDL